MPRRRTRTDEQRRAQLRVIQSRFRAKHRSELNAKRRAHYWRDIEKTREQQKRWNKTYNGKHKELNRQRSALYRLAHRDELLAKMKQWRQANLDRVLAYDRERSRLGYAAGDKLVYMKMWREKNPDKMRAFLRASFHKRRAQIAGDSFTAKEWLAVRAAFGERCAYCGKSAPVTVDHRIPLCRGGRNVISNVLPACKSCNSRKGRKTEAEFRAQLRAENPRALTPLIETIAVGPPDSRPFLSDVSGSKGCA